MPGFQLVSPMADVSADKFYSAIAELKQFIVDGLDRKTGEMIGRIDSKHASLRETLTDMDDKLDAHQQYTNRIENRVSVIESRLDTESKQAMRVTTWLAIVIPTGITALLKWLWK